MGIKFSNFGKAIVSSAPSGTTGLSFTVEAGKGLLFPSLGAGDYFYGIFKDASGNREVVKISARSTDSMTIATGGRGIDGSTARTWAAGDYFVAGVTNIALTESLGNANLGAIGNLTSAADKLPYFTGSGTADLATFTAFARSLLDDIDAAAARITLGMGSMATQAANNVAISGGAITGGTISGITDLAIADGGSGSSTAAGARTNFGLPYASDAQAQGGVHGSSVVTPDNLGATILGLGQSWQNMTASRAAATTYTNTTGRAIAINVALTSSAIKATAIITTGGVSLFGSFAPAIGDITRVAAVIPAGNTYLVSVNLGTPALFSNCWHELR